MTKTGDAARPPMELDAETLMDTVRAKSREITIGAIGVVVVVAIGMFWRSANQKKEENAEKAYLTAANSYYSGNLPLAQGDLQKLLQGYAGTTAGVEGAMLLAQIQYASGKHADGVATLEKAQKEGAAGPFQANLEALMAAGYTDQKKYDDAAKHYLAAADKAPFAADKDSYRADAARVLQLAGKKDEAKKIWTELAAKTDSPVSGEAKVRLGEVQ
jgi:predicted negative regulator of RcsB-dependent stress response